MEAKKMGRPAKFGVKMRRISVSLDEFTIAEARRRGDGSIAEGIRRAFSPPQVRGPVSQASQDALSGDTLPPQPQQP